MLCMIIDDITLYEIEGLIKQGYSLSINYRNGEDNTETRKVGVLELNNDNECEVYYRNTVDYDVFTGNINYERGDKNER